MTSKYAESGVDVKKRGIEFFKSLIGNLFPEAFCVVSEDPNLPGFGIVTHVDGAGSKPIQAYLHWKETGDISWFMGLAQDALAMNIDDIVCVGATPINFVDYVAVNPLKVDKIGLLRVLSAGFRECMDLLEDLGVRIIFSGGETADLPDQIRTVDISVTMNGRVNLSKVLAGNRIEPGDVIVGLRSGGKTRYEKRENSGIMCNGITLARLCLMHKSYQEKYPEILEGGDGKRSYYGRFRFDDYVDELGMTVGEAILSPTRFYAPVVLKIIEELSPYISGLIHNTGGGQTKCLRIGRNIHYIKDNIFDPDPIFILIQRESGESWGSMFENYNMGVGFEVIARPEAADDVISISEKFNLEARVIGRCERSDGGNKLTIRSKYGNFQYK
ncbi:phosphoribosylformylglycinamidine cyclo-ligase [Candidatus Bathyarchaeota archaeon]|nr:phosphoribosylformylglycinamidine cyclo-ligase [Candidatus Bathyarchaeota archaeon]